MKMFRKKTLMTIMVMLLLLVGNCNFSVEAKVTSVNELQDVKTTDWAYDALKRLVDKYGIQGYPDETFRGNNEASRYEMAAALDQVAFAIGEQLAELGIQKADKSDVQTIMKLQEEFATELAAFKLRAEAIEKKNLEQDSQIAEHKVRIEKIEKVRTKRDMVLLAQADQGGGQSNAIGATFRVRQDTEVTYHPDDPNSIWGEGKGFFRLTAAVGRVGPIANTIPTGTVLNLYNDVAAIDSATASDTVRNNGFFTNTRPVAFIEQAYLSQDIKTKWKGGKFNVSVGLADITNWFDLNAVANNECTQFLNGSLVNNRMFTSAFISPTLVGVWSQPLIENKLNLSLRAAMMSLDNAKLEGQFSALYEGGLQYFIKGKEGNFRVGGYNGYINSSDLAFVPVTGFLNRNNNGVYFNMDQQLYKRTKIFGRYGVANSSASTQALNNTRQAFSLGAELPVGDFFKKRVNDVFGLAYGFTTPISNISNNPLSINTKSEHLIEAYYKFQVNDMLSVGPDMQIIFDPGGFARPVTTVIGLRSYLSF